MTTGWIYQSDLWSATASGGSSLTNLIKTEMNFQSGTTESCHNRKTLFQDAQSFSCYSKLKFDNFGIIVSCSRTKLGFTQIFEVLCRILRFFLKSNSPFYDKFVSFLDVV